MFRVQFPFLKVQFCHSEVTTETTECAENLKLRVSVSPWLAKILVFCARISLVVPKNSIDENGRVNNVAYVQWMQDIAVEHYDSIRGL